MLGLPQQVALDALYGKRDIDNMFSFVCEIDEDDDYSDPACWPKANPAYPKSPTCARWLKNHYNESKRQHRRHEVVPQALLRRMARKFSRPYMEMDLVDAVMVDELSPYRGSEEGYACSSESTWARRRTSLRYRAYGVCRMGVMRLPWTCGRRRIRFLTRRTTILLLIVKW